MQIALHLGAHCTDDGAALKVLRQNHAMLAEQGIWVPAPDSYPHLLRAAAQAFSGHPPDAETSAALIRNLLPDPLPDGLRAGIERLVFSFESFLAFPAKAISDKGLYPEAETRLRGLATLFPGRALTFAIALRNPATLLPALHDRLAARDLPPLPQDLRPETLRWQPLIASLRKAAPQARLLVWCDEDAPVLWHRILREIAGFDEASELAGALDRPLSLLPAGSEGARMLTSWFETRRPDRDYARAAAIAAALRDHADPALLTAPAGLQSWSGADLAAVSARYDQDCATIAQMPGVEFLIP